MLEVFRGFLTLYIVSRRSWVIPVILILFQEQSFSFKKYQFLYSPASYYSAGQ